MSFFTHILACLFGTGSWVSINGVWVELPLIVPEIPEGWYLPSYLLVLIQMANVGPLFITLMHHFHPGLLNEVVVIYVIITLGVLASFLLAFFWKETLEISGVHHSVPLFILTFFLSIVDCTSSVTFLPFMTRLKPKYLTTYFIGEGLSGLIPALVALIQGVGMVQCTNYTQTLNETLDNSTVTSHKLRAHYQPANFSTQAFFIFLSTMMVVCLAAFLLLNHCPAVRWVCKDNHCLKQSRQEKVEPGFRKQTKSEKKPMVSHHGKPCRSFGTGMYSLLQYLFIFLTLAWVNALTNAVLPSVQSYSCLPYGNKAYHLSATMAAVANPLACFIAMFFAVRSLLLIGVLTLTGTGIGAYIMGMAVLSPCPVLVHYDAGTVLMVGAWVLFVLTLSYVKVIIGLILRDEGYSALVWCGAVLQLGSMLGALSMFPLVSVYKLFSSGDPCNTTCPK